MRTGFLSSLNVSTLSVFWPDPALAGSGETGGPLDQSPRHAPRPAVWGSGAHVGSFCLLAFEGKRRKPGIVS